MIGWLVAKFAARWLFTTLKRCLHVGELGRLVVRASRAELPWPYFDLGNGLESARDWSAVLEQQEEEEEEEEEVVVVESRDERGQLACGRRKDNCQSQSYRIARYLCRIGASMHPTISQSATATLRLVTFRLLIVDRS